jgi:hypothetical protein
MMMTIGDWTAGAIMRWDAGTIERFEDWTVGVELVDYHQDEEGQGSTSSIGGSPGNNWFPD